MDKRYELYCLADPLFYESPDNVLTAELNFEISRRRLPDGWQMTPLGEWLVCTPPADPIPTQGWKIHVSACLDNAEKVLDAVWQHCVGRRIEFKFLRSRHVLFLRNAKYAPRGYSGKLITIYPRDDSELEIILKELGQLLDGEPGPYILSDLRIGDGPLYVRYGGFAERYCTGDNGELVTAIEDAEGRLVPDRRGVVFAAPDWVRLPEFLEPHLQARDAVTVKDLPYDITEALHFSNGGGVYRARVRATGEEVVLKEARPHAGLALDKADAVARLRRERAVLERLSGLGVAPGFRDYFTLGEHEFLVQEFIEGEALNSIYADRHPLLDPDGDAEKAAEYANWAMKVFRAVENAVAAIHERGVVINDLHMFNVMVRPDDSVRLIDFEAAALPGEDSKQILAAPGFQAPSGWDGFSVDEYALACMRLAMFMPMTVLFSLDPAKAADLASVITGQFPVDREFLESAVRTIGQGETGPARTPGECTWSHVLTPDAEGWRRTRESVNRAIQASATPDREDRLFPGDIQQFDDGGHGLAHGAAGVLHALSVTGAQTLPEHEEWLLGWASNVPSGTRLGLYDGLAGVAYALERLGHRAAALRMLERCLDEKWERLGTDLSGGLPGIGLTLDHLATATGETSLRDLAATAAEITADKVEAADADVGTVSGDGRSYAGLLRGSSGPALFFLRRFETTGDAALLDHAALAIRQDLRRCTLDRNGALQINEGWRTMPYLARGSTGIGCVLDDYLRHRQEDDLVEAAEQIRRAALSPFYIQPGLFDGRAGILYYLSRRKRQPGDPAIAMHVRNLAWHALSFRGHLAFPGSQLQRLSMDLATGGAGVLLAMSAALDSKPAGLPFLAPGQQSPDP